MRELLGPARPSLDAAHEITDEQVAAASMGDTIGGALADVEQRLDRD